MWQPLAHAASRRGASGSPARRCAPGNAAARAERRADRSGQSGRTAAPVWGRERPHGRPGASWCVSPARSPFFHWFGGLWFGDDGLCFSLSCLHDNLGPIRYRPSGFLLQVGSRGVWTFVAWPALWFAPDPSRMPGRTVAGGGSSLLKVIRYHVKVIRLKAHWAPTPRPAGHQHQGPLGKR